MSRLDDSPTSGQVPLKIAFATLGCKVNQYDSATIGTLLRQHGCTVVPFAAGADVCIVNSCTVTDRADAESRQLVRRAKRLNPRARVVLTGCFAQTQSREAAALPEVDYVVGIGRLPDILRAVRGEVGDEEDPVFVDDVRRASRVSTFGAQVFTGQTRAFLKVQEGCDLFCSFCIVPFARGRSRSVPPRQVLDELKRLAERGFQEVVLTGIHLGGYGRDLTPAVNLVDLVEMMSDVAPMARIRLSSIDPPEVTSRLLGLMARSKVLCPHLHMPVQAGVDSVLHRMRRRYDTALVADVITEIRRVLPTAGLGTDVIAGFPGESDAEFASGVDFLRQASFTYFHVFPYSRRTGTTAAKARDPVPRQTVTARARVLRRLGATKRRVFATRFVGTELPVLIEHTRDRETGCLVGYSRNYLRVLLAGSDGLMNSEVAVRATTRCGDRLVGTAVAPVHDKGSAVGG